MIQTGGTNRPPFMLGFSQSTPHHPMTLNVASDLKTRQIVWVRNGAKIQSGPAHIWAALGRQNRL